MKIRRCSVTVVAASFFIVLGTAQISQGGPITYSFSGVLGDCTTPQSGCNNDLSGHTVVGQFTTDSAISTLVAAAFTVIGGNFTWRILFPDPLPNSTIFGVSPMGVFILESLLTPFGNEDFVLGLDFNSPLTPTTGSTLQSGFIARPSADIRSPFVSGEVTTAAPEPSSLLLLATGLIGLACIVGARRRGAFNVMQTLGAMLISASALITLGCSGSRYTTATAPTSTPAPSTLRSAGRTVTNGDLNPQFSVQGGATAVTTNDIVSVVLLGSAIICPGHVPDIVSGPVVFHILRHETRNPDGSDHFVTLMNVQHSEVTGQVTGLKYEVTGAAHVEFNLTPGASVDTQVNNFRIAASGPDMDYILHYLLHTTINAEGVVTATIENLTSECPPS